MYAFVAKGADVCFHSSWQVCHARLRLRLIRRCCFCLCLHMQLFRHCRNRLRLFDCSRNLCLHLQLFNRCRSRLCSCCLVLRPYADCSTAASASVFACGCSGAPVTTLQFACACSPLGAACSAWPGPLH